MLHQSYLFGSIRAERLYHPKSDMHSERGFGEHFFDQLTVSLRAVLESAH